MNPIEFARNLFLLRREHKMTIEDLSAALEVTPEIVCEWECAKTSPTLDQMNRLAKIYGIPLADVIRSPRPIDGTPVATQTPESASPAEPNSVPEPEEVPETAEPPREESVKGKKRPAPWEILVIVLLLLIITAAVIFLLRPQWFPFRDLLGAWHSFKQFG